ASPPSFMFHKHFVPALVASRPAEPVAPSKFPAPSRPDTATCPAHWRPDNLPILPLSKTVFPPVDKSYHIQRCLAVTKTAAHQKAESQPPSIQATSHSSQGPHLSPDNLSAPVLSDNVELFRRPPARLCSASGSQEKDRIHFPTPTSAP